MKKLEVGMYVRLNNSVYNTVVINRIANVYEHTILTENDGSMYEGEYSKEEIKNASYNIIDLIEVGDLLKIEEQKGIYTICEVEEFKDKYSGIKFLGVILGNKPIGRRLWELNIKSIVTKEQFEQMKYEVE